MMWVMDKRDRTKKGNRGRLKISYVSESDLESVNLRSTAAMTAPYVLSFFVLFSMA